MEGVLFILIVFGGGMMVVLSKTEIGRAVADRIRGEPRGVAPDPALLEEVDRLRHEVTELQERMDFAERMLAARREPDRLGSA
jgi:ubiquinone biosynthesis protein UbiJ